MTGNLYALLVGINEYPNPGPPPLRGCVGDVMAMRDFLLGALGAPGENVLMLTNEQATRHAIIDGWQTHLRDHAGPGDMAFFYFSGHGSQSASDDPDEPDGLAESLVAYDSRQEGQFDLLDKELMALIRMVEEKGAQVVLIMDCCHSGHITRTGGDDRPRARQCPPDRRPRPPATLLQTPTAVTRSGSPDAANRRQSDGHLLLAACRDEQLANEYRTPETHEWRGALSYFLLKSILPYRPTQTWADVYDQLLAEVRAVYPQQTPQLEGDGARLLFAGAAPAIPAYLIVLATGEAGEITVSGGAAMGLTSGSSLAIYPPESDLRGHPLALALIADAKTDQATATLDRPARVAVGSRVKITGFGYGEQQSVIAVDDPQVRQAIATANQGQPSAFLRLADSVIPTSNPDFAVMRTADHFEIQDAAGEQLLAKQPLLGAAGAAQIVRLLEHLTLYRNVLRLRNLAADPVLRSALSVVELTPTAASGGHRMVHPGQRIAFRLHNQSRQPLYLTVLQLDPTYAIRRLYPDRAYTEKIAAGGKTPMISTKAISGPMEQIDQMVFKVFATTTPTSFDSLCLPALDQGDLYSGEVVRTDSPLAWLLKAVRRTGTRPIRPVAEGVDDQWVVQNVEFRIAS
jgi:hypothetical protein